MAERLAERVREGNGAAPQVQEEVVVRAPARIRAVTTMELEAQQTHGPRADVPQDLMQEAISWMDEYKGFLTERAELYALRHRGPGPEVGQPTIGTYVAWDILSLSPIELGALAYQHPNKIMRSGSLCLLLSVMWTNPVISVADGFAVPANIQLGGRQARVSFDRLNLTTGAGGPSIVSVFTLPAPVPPIILLPFFFVAPAVAAPELLEFNVTADITDPAQPYAAFGTWHADWETEPSWFAGYPPAVPPELVHDIPNRCMVYPE